MVPGGATSIREGHDLAFLLRVPFGEEQPAPFDIRSQSADRHTQPEAIGVEINNSVVDPNIWFPGKEPRSFWHTSHPHAVGARFDSKREGDATEGAVSIAANFGVPC